MFKKISIMIMIISTLFLFANQVFAYTYCGTGKWSTNSVNYAIDTSVPAGHVTPVANAASWWGSKTHFSFIRNSSSKVNIYEYNYGATGWDGSSVMNPDWNSTFSYGNSQLNSYYTSSYSALHLQLVAAHELGHEICLDHVNTYVMMYGSDVWVAYNNNNNLANGPQADDIAGVNNRY